MSKGAEFIDNLYVKFFFDPLMYTLPECTLIPSDNDGGVEMDAIKLESLRNDQLIGVYRNLRDRREAAKKEFVESQKPALELMAKIENELQRRMHEQGTNTFSCDTGTAYKTVDTSVKVEDWAVFFSFVMETQAFDMLERRAAKLAVVDFVEHTHEVPPGLSIKSEESVNIRAPRGG